MGATEFDDSGEDIGEFDGGALYSQQQLNEQRRRAGRMVEAGETLREINELERGWDTVVSLWAQACKRPGQRGTLSS